MTISDLKLEIFRRIDALEKNRLEELHGVLLNYLNNSSDTSEWDKLPALQKNGILEAIDEINQGNGIPHENIIAKYRSEYLNG